MDKRSFLKYYREPKIRTIFDDRYFSICDEIEVRDEKKIPLKKFLDFYIQRHQKKGVICRTIEREKCDQAYRTIKLCDATKYPEFKNVPPKIIPPPIQELWPIPIATDLGNNKTLILDSNHILISLSQDEEKLQEMLKVREIVGRNLKNFVPDFEILAR